MKWLLDRKELQTQMKFFIKKKKSAPGGFALVYQFIDCFNTCVGETVVAYYGIDAVLRIFLKTTIYIKRP